MSFGMIIRSLFEVALIGFTLWAVLHEEQIAAVEQRFFAKLRRRRFKVVDGNKTATRYPVREH